MRTRLSFVVVLFIGVVVSLAMSSPQAAETGFTTDFGLERSDTLVPNGENDYFSLQPGTFLRFEGDDDGEFVELEITLLNQVRPITFKVNGVRKTVITRVLEEREWEDGELIEVSRNYFARDPKTNNIYYFGEEVDIYEDGEIVSHDGAWMAGRNGAKPGLIMPGSFLLGSKYFQEVAPGIALDRARNASSGMVVDTPAGEFEDCVMIVETTPLEPGSESIKIYAPGIGLIFDDGVELVEFRRGSPSTAVGKGTFFR